MKLHTILSLVLLLSLPLFAQEEKGIRLRFLSGVQTTSLDDAQLRNNDWNSEAFRIPANQLSRPQSVKLRALRLHHQADAPEAKPICNIILPETGRDFIVILIEKKKNIESVIIPGDSPGFRPGDVFLQNSSEQSIAGSLGSTRVSLRSGDGKAVRPGTAADARLYDAAFVYDENGVSRRLAISTWPLNKKLRAYVFFLPGPDGRPQYRAVQEHVEAE